MLCCAQNAQKMMLRCFLIVLVNVKHLCGALFLLLLQMFGSPDKRFICLGPAAGFSDHYGERAAQNVRCF
jgi:hypothetical protein